MHYITAKVNVVIVAPWLLGRKIIKNCQNIPISLPETTMEKKKFSTLTKILDIIKNQ